MSRLVAASYCNTEFPLETNVEMRSARDERSKSPFRRRPRRDKRDLLLPRPEIAYHERRRSFTEDPGLLETSAIEVVLETRPVTPRRVAGGAVSKQQQQQQQRQQPQQQQQQPQQQQSPKQNQKEGPNPLALQQKKLDTSISSSSSENTPTQDVKREDLKRKSFKQKYMQKKSTPQSTPDTRGTGTTNSSTVATHTRTTSKTVALDDRNPLETSRRCFPFSVHATSSSRGRSVSRGCKAAEILTDPVSSSSNSRVHTPLRTRARSLSRRAQVAPTPKTPKGTSSRPNTDTTPLIDPTQRGSHDDSGRPDDEENPDPAIEQKLCRRPKLLSRFEDHGPSHTSGDATFHAGATPQQITLARQKSMFSEVSTPSTIRSQHPVVQHMEQSLADATKKGLKIDRLLVYQTLLQISDSLESPEEQAAMQREITALIESQGGPTPSRVIPADTFPEKLSESLGPATTTPPRKGRSNLSTMSSSPLSRAGKQEDASDDGFTEWAEDLESQSSESTDVSADTIQFLSDMFNFGSFFGGDNKDRRDDEQYEDEGEDNDEPEENEVQVPESWNNFRPPPGIQKPPKVVRRRSYGLRNRNKDNTNQQNKKKSPTGVTSATDSDLSFRFAGTTKPSKGTPAEDKKAWWRKKGSENVETQGRLTKERSLLKEEDNLSLSSIESLQYKAPRRNLEHPPRLPPDGSPTRHGTRDGQSIPTSHPRRSKSVDGRRTMLM